MQHIWLELELYNMLLAALHVFPCLIPSQVSGLNRNLWWQWKMGGALISNSLIHCIDVYLAPSVYPVKVKTVCFCYAIKLLIKVGPGIPEKVSGPSSCLKGKTSQQRCWTWAPMCLKPVTYPHLPLTIAWQVNTCVHRKGGVEKVARN